MVPFAPTVSLVAWGIVRMLEVIVRLLTLSLQLLRLLIPILRCSLQNKSAMLNTLLSLLWRLLCSLGGLWMPKLLHLLSSVSIWAGGRIVSSYHRGVLSTGELARFLTPLHLILHADSNKTSHSSTYLKHESEKCRMYEQRVREVERVSFVPIVLSAVREKENYL